MWSGTLHFVILRQQKAAIPLTYRNMHDLKSMPQYLLCYLNIQCVGRNQKKICLCPVVLAKRVTIGVVPLQSQCLFSLFWITVDTGQCNMADSVEEDLLPL